MLALIKLKCVHTQTFGKPREKTDHWGLKVQEAL